MKAQLENVIANAELINAAPAMALKSQSASDVALQLVQVIGSLGLVIGLVFVLAYLVKRNQNFSGHEKKLKILERLSVTNKDQLLLVSLHDKEILLGVSASGLNALHVFEARAEPCAVAKVNTDVNQGDQIAPTEIKPPSFASHLQHILAARMAS